MILLIPAIVVVEQQPEKPLRLADSVVSFPAFKYPAMFRITLIQGVFSFRIRIESGSVTEIKQTTEDPMKLGPGLVTALEKQIKSILFNKMTSGYLDLFIQLKLTGERVSPENSRSKMVVHYENNLIEIESNPLLAQISDAPPK
jgi:hypothetical protein